MSDQLIETQQDGHVQWLYLNSPENGNALGEELIESFVRTLRISDADPNIRCIVLSGRGKHFCTGGDVKKMRQKSGMFFGEPNQLRLNYQRGIQQIPIAMEALSTPVIAMVHGAAIGAGLDLACMCDLRVAGRDALFAQSFTKLGLISGDGGAFFLQRIVGYAKAAQMCLTAQSYNAQEALAMGLVHYVEDELRQKTEELAQVIAQRPPAATQMSKRLLIHAYRQHLREALDLAAAYQGIAQNHTEHTQALESSKK